jgi:hypothetical protein
MNHRAIEDGNLVERYVNRTLPAEELAPFEEHLVECAECLEQVEWTERLRDGLRAYAASTPVPRTAPRRVRAWPQARQFLPLAAGIAAAVVGTALVERTLWQAQLERERATSATWQSRYDAERRGRAADAQDHAAPKPSANVKVLLLSAVRGAGPAAAPPLALAPADAWALLSLELEPDPDFASYAARLRAPDGAELWHGEGLHAQGTALALLLPSDLLRAGRHTLDVSGVRRDGRREPVAAYAFAAQRP